MMNRLLFFAVLCVFLISGESRISRADTAPTKTASDAENRDIPVFPTLAADFLDTSPELPPFEDSSFLELSRPERKEAVSADIPASADSGRRLLPEAAGSRETDLPPKNGVKREVKKPTDTGTAGSATGLSAAEVLAKTRETTPASDKPLPSGANVISGPAVSPGARTVPLAEPAPGTAPPKVSAPAGITPAEKITAPGFASPASPSGTAAGGLPGNVPAAAPVFSDLDSEMDSDTEFGSTYSPKPSAALPSASVPRAGAISADMPEDDQFLVSPNSSKNTASGNAVPGSGSPGSVSSGLPSDITSPGGAFSGSVSPPSSGLPDSFPGMMNLDEEEDSFPPETGLGSSGTGIGAGAGKSPGTGTGASMGTLPDSGTGTAAGKNPYNAAETESRTPASSSDLNRFPAKSSSETPSANRELIQALTALPKSTLENVESVSLGEFMDRLSRDDAAVKRGVQAYWEAAESAGTYLFWKNHLAFLEHFSESTPGGGKNLSPTLLQTAIIAARAAAEYSLAALRTNAVRLGEIGNYSREVWPSDLPHTGGYNTRYENFAENGDASPRLAILDRLIRLRYEQWTSSAAAYRAAEYVLQELADTRAPLGEILQAAEAVRHRREVMFRALTQYNMDILDYVLEVSYKRGSSLAPLLVIRPPQAESPTAASPVKKPESGSGTKSFSEIPSAPGDGKSEKNISGDVFPWNPEDEMAVPRIPEGRIPADTDTGIPVYDDHFYEMDDMTAPSAVIDYGAPGIRETAPPGSEFQPIGGERGSTSTLPSTPSALPARGTSPPSGGGTPAPSGGSSGRRDSKMFHFVSRQSSGTEKFEKYEAPGEYRHVASGEMRSVVKKLSDAENKKPQNISLEDVLQRVSPPDREKAVKDYWRYAILQAQRLVLTHQLRLLETLRREQLQGDSAATDALAGLRLSAATQALIAAKKSHEADSWRVIFPLLEAGAFLPEEVSVLPVAATLPNSGEYRLHLDEIAPGTPRHDRAVHLARHLEFCTRLLSQANQDMETLQPLIGPTPKDSVPRLPRQADFADYFMSLENARSASANYLRLIYTVNSALASCTFAADSVGFLSPQEIVKRLCE